MKIKNKSKVHPTPSSSSSSSSCSAFNGDYFSVLKLLPAAIITLIAVLSLEDREVLAYMISRSLKTTITAGTRSFSSSVVEDSKNGKKKRSKKQTAVSHKPPVFDCDCFDCYTSYWFRWDSSPNRELIHQAIEAFEDHLTKDEAGKSRRNGKRKEKSDRRFMDRAESTSPVLEGSSSSSSPKVEEELLPNLLIAVEDLKLTDNNKSPLSPIEEVSGNGEADVAETSVDSPEETLNIGRPESVGGSKGLARKFLPDVMGLLNSRLWSLWNPNV